MKTWRLLTNIVFPAAAFFAARPASAADSKELLHLDFDDKAHVTLQPAPLPLGTVVWDAGASPDFPGSLSLGDSGYIRVPGFRNPQGPFSFEARFRLNQYAPLDTRYISDIINTATWDLPGPQINQGAGMRIGGGYLYATLPQDAYANPADYNADIGWYADDERASVSKCIGEFVIANKDAAHPWIEAVTDRCISRNTWVHMVGVWDGANAHLYLNGQYATDTLRLNGKGGTPFMAPEAIAFVGARAEGRFDSRHLDGTLDYVRIVDSAMGVAEIRSRYRQTLSQESDTLCHGSILPEYPYSGQAVTPETEFRFRIVVDGACTQPGFKPTLLPNDSIEVEIASDFEFVNVLVRMVVKDQVFKIDPLKVLTFTDYTGAAYWRARVMHGAAAKSLAKATAEPDADWSLARPLMLNLKKATVGLASRSRIKATSRILVLPGSVLSVPARGALVPGLWSLDGARSPIAWVRNGNSWTARLDGPQGLQSLQRQRARLLVLGWE